MQTVKSNAKKILDEFGSEITNEERIFSRIPGNYTKDYHAPIITIKSLQIDLCKKLLKKLDASYGALQSVYHQYKGLFDVYPKDLHTVPRKTSTFCEIKPYVQVFEMISRWFDYGEYGLEKDRLILPVKVLDKLFEYYCLRRLLKLLEDNGYQEEEIFRYRYTSANATYQNEKDVANTYRLSKNGIRATLYYQPVINSNKVGKDNNELTLFRTTTSYYTPDFVLKFSSSEDNEEYVIFDAKFSNRKNINNNKLLDKIILKYSCEFCVAANNRAPRMVWILQGRVDTEKPVWSFHNHNLRLVSQFPPITSYGIASVNTEVDIGQQLWNEIKNNVSLV